MNAPRGIIAGDPAGSPRNSAEGSCQKLLLQLATASPSCLRLFWHCERRRRLAC